MNLISNLKIGTKIALMLGANVLLLVSLAAVAIWGISISESLTTDVKDRVAKAHLIDVIVKETLSLGQNSGRIVIGRQATDTMVDQILSSRKTRLQALADFKAAVHTPTSVKQASELSELVKANAVANDRVIVLVRAGRWGEIGEAFRVSSEASERVRAKADEAVKWQAQLGEEHDQARRGTARLIWTVLIGGSLAALLVALAGGTLLTFSIATPLGSLASNLDQVAQGDVSKNVPEDLQKRGDEIGSMAQGMQKMIQALREMIQEIASGIQVLSSSSSELMAGSSIMSSGSRLASDNAHSVSAAAEQMSSNIASVAAGMELAATNLAHVASTTEQMTGTVGEIAANSAQARKITDGASRQVAQVTEQINQLGLAAREIGKVTAVITEISSQTNLLALNATIEAARAGSAGKGFAVVATEIKALAQQTATATEDIKERVASVQSATAGGVAEIARISDVIAEVNAIVASIAAAIEEQAIATKDIARNIGEASTGVTDANLRVAETSVVSREIAKDITGVDRAAGEMAKGGEDVRASAVNLSTVAAGLQESVARFHA